MKKKLDITPEILQQIEQMAAKGVTEAQIAQLVDLHPNTFSAKKKEHPEIGEAIKRGKAQGAEYAVGILRQAMNLDAVNNPKLWGPKLSATIFYLKTQCGWSTTVIQQTEPAPRPTKIAFDKE